MNYEFEERQIESAQNAFSQTLCELRAATDRYCAHAESYLQEVYLFMKKKRLLLVVDPVLDNAAGTTPLNGSQTPTVSL